MPIIILLIVHGLAVFKLSHQKPIFLRSNFERQSSFKPVSKSKPPVEAPSQKNEPYNTSL
jgi:hypothetical protein